MKHFICTALRYAAAIAVAFVTSTMILWSMASFLKPTMRVASGLGFAILLVSMSIVFVFTGFAGVYAGARCLPPARRRFGSVILSFLGLAFSASMTALLLVLLQPKSYWDFFTLLPAIWGMSMLAIGATGAILLIRRLWPDAVGSPAIEPPPKGQADEAKNLS